MDCLLTFQFFINLFQNPYATFSAMIRFHNELFLANWIFLIIIAPYLLSILFNYLDLCSCGTSCQTFCSCVRKSVIFKEATVRYWNHCVITTLDQDSINTDTIQIRDTLSYHMNYCILLKSHLQLSH